MSEDICHIKLTTGHDIICDVVGQLEDQLIVDSPMSLMEAQTSEGVSTLILERFAPYAKENIIQIQRNHIVSITDVYPEISKYYYLSLKLSVGQTEYMIKKVAAVNTLIEQVLTKQILSETDFAVDTNPTHFVNGTDTVN